MTTLKVLKIGFFCCVVILYNCQTKTQEKRTTVLAKKEGHLLTTEHETLYYAMIAEINGAPLTSEEKKEYKQVMLEEFQKDPSEAMEALEAYIRLQEKSEIKMDSKKIEMKTDPIKNDDSNFIKKEQRQDLAHGFQQFRKAMAYHDKSIFETADANALRNYFINSIIRHEKSETYGSNDFYGNTTYIEVMQFCGDGTFVFQNNSGVSASGSGVDGLGQDGATFQGVWDTFYEQGRAVLALYCQDPFILQVNPKGFLPMWIKSYDTKTVRIANDPEDKLYRKMDAGCRQY